MPSIGSQPLIGICNRCIPYLNDDLAANPCDGAFGAFAKKCSRCARSRHACVGVEPLLFGDLNDTVRARAAHARAMRTGNEDEVARTRAKAETLGDNLKSRLRLLDRNRNRVAGDKTTPRKTRAGAALAVGGSSEQLLELQSLRRGMLALVEVGKLFLHNQGVDTVSVNRILGADGPAPSPVESESEGEGEEEDEQMEGGEVQG